MVKKKLLGFNMILVAIALTISLVAFSSIGRSRAWLSSNHQVDALGMTVSTQLKSKITSSIKSYGVVDISDKNNVFVLESKDGQGNRPEIYELPVVDPNNISYSQYERALVVFVELLSTEDVMIDVMLQTPNASPIFTEKNHFSNCIQITAATYNDAQGTATKDVTSVQSFVQISNGTCSKRTSITVSERVSLKKNEPISLCYVMEYNSDFIDYINHYILENALMITEVDYKNDIEFSIIESIS